ncbi:MULTISPECIES: hypothetical protein [Rhizobium]|uniref:hypothetical protein n=1 Tax=Rhizobium TaxID=379 RepID=UPI001C840A72|nr:MULTISPECIES: hypothetical protein [Rhizobium]MBX4899656.1 hypothetical protein [Rhizobium bangladeshense]MBX5297574.1 hypothetical protein [Rhizobium sp. NLR15a]MBY3617847.1 hypothetical protein [Rhizobium bangladeshense]
MLFLTAASLGVCVSMVHSVFSIVSIAFLIVVPCVTATLLSSGPESCLNLLIAVLGYNAGLISVIVGMLVSHRLRATFQGQSARI